MMMGREETSSFCLISAIVFFFKYLYERHRHFYFSRGFSRFPPSSSNRRGAVGTEQTLVVAVVAAAAVSVTIKIRFFSCVFGAISAGP